MNLNLGPLMSKFNEPGLCALGKRHSCLTYRRQSGSRGTEDPRASVLFAPTLQGSIWCSEQRAPVSEMCAFGVQYVWIPEVQAPGSW